MLQAEGATLGGQKFAAQGEEERRIDAANGFFILSFSSRAAAASKRKSQKNHTTASPKNMVTWRYPILMGVRSVSGDKVGENKGSGADSAH